MQIGEVTRFIPSDWTWYGTYKTRLAALQRAKEVAKMFDTTKVRIKITENGEYSVYKGPFTIS